MHRANVNLKLLPFKTNGAYFFTGILRIWDSKLVDQTHIQQQYLNSEHTYSS